ncbi:alpha/beta hydrolase [Paenibacillus sp. JCM 10914]|uniref:alpha/beta fold hydrolase n=1 Tax=Paenibacillus sp. JCM 10914 TaxID=1236974 RepID=UPI0003CC5FF9|nr:alpha/beta hydrolase [Paenibacillus sp. JCM 10914]GAE06278.1 hydrolase, alpha/beta fold family [Paenibacillus sp. JCM 10914]
MTEQLFTINQVEICTESFGHPADPALLLMMGAQSSMVWWEDEFCERLANAGRFVIRYDNRDVGRSTVYELGQPGYTFGDMADDAVGILNAYGIKQAHIAGMSMGGMLTQLVALRHAERVLTVTLIATSNFAPDLPPMEEKVMDFFAHAGAVDWSDDEAAIEFSVGKWRVLSGSKYPFDEERIQYLARKELARSHAYASMNNHGLVGGELSDLARIADIHVPALIVHGTEDPIIPYPHGLALADTIPNAVLLTLEGSGHEIHPAEWDSVIDAIIQHTAVITLD